METKIFGFNFTDVSFTNLITLYSHVHESMDKDPILVDIKATEIVKLINDELLKSENKMIRKLASGKLRKDLRIHIATRANKYDEYAKNFIIKNPNGVIVNLGCGFDTRYHRISLKDTMFYDLDLPEVIEIKKQILEEQSNYKLLGYSVFDTNWITEIKEKNVPILFIAEGLFMYLPQEKVEGLVKLLSSTFENSELLCEVSHKKYTKGFYKKMLEFKFKRELKLGENSYYKFGLVKSNDFEVLNNSIKLIEDWSYFDSNIKKIGWIKVLRHFKSIRYTQWTVYYKL